MLELANVACYDWVWHSIAGLPSDYRREIHDVPPKTDELIDVPQESRGETEVEQRMRTGTKWCDGGERECVEGAQWTRHVVAARWTLRGESEKRERGKARSSEQPGEQEGWRTMPWAVE